MKPTVEIDVDEVTGIWTTDGFPMVYVPRHFLVNLHKASEKAMGRTPFQTVTQEASMRSAYVWCEREAAARGYSGAEVFAHYLERLSARGWGQFGIERMDESAGTATVTVANSIYVLEARDRSEQTACYAFNGFFAGGFQYVLDRTGETRIAECRETACAAAGAPSCRFEITSR